MHAPRRQHANRMPLGTHAELAVVRQCAVAEQAVELGAASKAFDLALPHLGPYRVAFSRSGRWLAMAGGKGHLALTDWSRMYTACEVQVRGAA